MDAQTLTNILNEAQLLSTPQTKPLSLPAGDSLFSALPKPKQKELLRACLAGGGAPSLETALAVLKEQGGDFTR